MTRYPADPRCAAGPCGPLARPDGFALPAAIFALVVVALLVTAGFYMSGQESRIGQSVERGAAARILAETGLNEAAATWRPAQSGNLQVGGEALVGTQDVGEGRWTVSVTQVDDAVYLMQSMGEITQGGRLAGATRTLFQMLRLPPLDLNAPQAALSTQGTVVVGGNAQVDGNNSNGPANWTLNQTCGVADPSLTKPGILLDEGSSAVKNNGNPVSTGDQLSQHVDVAGAPPYVNNDNQIVAETMAVFGGDSWSSLVAMADVRISRPATSGYIQVANGNLNPNIGPSLTTSGQCNYADSRNWGALENPTHACASYMPVIHLLGGPGAREFTIPSGSSGQGILLVDGDLRISGAFNWSGLILVNGRLRTDGGGGGDPQILGAVVAQNSELDTQSVTGNSLIRYSHCAIEQAINLARANLAPRPFSERSWVDATAAGF
jgi:hypothetical protein